MSPVQWLIYLFLFVAEVENRTLTNNSQEAILQNGNTMNSSCVSSEECVRKLACISGECVCNEQHIWDGNDCIQLKPLDALCSKQFECGDTLFCHNGRCRCHTEDHWNGYSCISKTSINGTCEKSHDCSGKLLCLDKECQCPTNHFWDDHQCSFINVIGTLCEENNGCFKSLYCIHGTCQCAADDYWTPNKCVPRLKLQARCESSYECYGKLVCIKGRCSCSEQHYWNGTNCKTIIIPDSPCLTERDCDKTLICSNGKCQCPNTDFWNEQRCLQRKPMNSSCLLSSECQDSLECVDGKCICIPSKMVQWENGKCSYAYPRECQDLDADVDGVYKIYPKSMHEPVIAYCIMEHQKKWTVIQRRMDGSVDFYRTWDEYKAGFGSAKGEYWLGNDKIHAISSNGIHELSIHMWISSGEQQTANYSTFHVGNEQSKYLLFASEYSGTAGDSIIDESGAHKMNGQRFTTRDQDNDNYRANCATVQNGGWWYNDCHVSDFNRKYSSLMYWRKWSSAITKSVLMIRKK